MSRQHILNGVYVSETAARQHVLAGVYLNEPPQAYTLIAAAGSYALTGAAAILKAARLVTASVGSYAVTGTDAALVHRLFLRPDADGIDGGWTNELGGTTLFSSIDEITLDDSDYIQSAVNPSLDVAKISLSNPSVEVGSPVKLRYRYKKSASPAADLTVRLLQGVTEIATWTHTGISASFVTSEQTLSAPQLASITDFDDLYIELTADS